VSKAELDLDSSGRFSREQNENDAVFFCTRDYSKQRACFFADNSLGWTLWARMVCWMVRSDFIANSVVLMKQ